MDFDLFSCTFENLNSLKFNELQKLSSHFRLNKRWAKKREIIEKLLSLRDQEIEKRGLLSKNAEKNAHALENEQWIDGNKLFSSASNNENSNTDEIDRRLTYNVCNPTAIDLDRRLTFSVVNNEGNQTTRDVNLEVHDNFDRRLTYNADEIKGINRFLKTETTISKEEVNTENVLTSAPVEKVEKRTNQLALISTHKERPEYFGPSKHLLWVQDKYNTNGQEIHGSSKFDGRIPAASQKSVKNSKMLKPVKTKMLTIPYSRIPTQSIKSTDVGANDCDYAKTKLSSNKPTKSRLATSKTRDTLQEKDPKVIGVMKPVVDLSNNLSAAKKNFHNPLGKKELSNLSHTSRILPRRKSKTEDNVLVENLKSRMNLKFFSPTEYMKNLKRLSEGNNHHFDNNPGSKIPKVRAVVEIPKPLTAKKMPDFSKIHQRQFDQMDSILDHKKKREERTKKLFGIPQPGVPEKINKAKIFTGLFQFKSCNGKENLADKSIETIREPLQTGIKHSRKKPSRQDILSHAGSKSNIVKNVKEQNRKQLNGVRTNKRFELQMKFRKM